MEENKHIIRIIGSKIKSLRNGKGWKLGELAVYSKISIAMLSKIENGRVYPTFPTLLKILKTLEVDLNEFFEDVKSKDNFPGYLLIKKEAYQIANKEDSVGFIYETILTQDIQDSSLEISLLTLQPGAKREMVITEGFEFIYLIKGSILYYLREEELLLNEGDSLYFDGRIAHVPKNRLDKDALLLVVYLINRV